jgi:two-component system, LytTR family, response regulator LytT
MRVLIIEDEALIASRIERMVKDILGAALNLFARVEDLEASRSFLNNNEIDLVLLDLNLNGENGFAILRDFSSRAFHTIIISAYKDKALEAFEYGVLDFVAKPFDRARLELALGRAMGTTLGKADLKLLHIRQKGQIRLVSIDEVLYFKGADIYSEVYLINGEILLHDKSLEKLSQLLTDSFQRIHKSYLVAIKLLDRIILRSGGSIMIRLKNGTELPVGRTRYAALKKKLNGF